MTHAHAGDPVVTVSGLHMRYGEKHVLEGIDLTVGAEEVVAVLGPNGAGKTTTIEILEGFRMRSGGEVTVLGEDPAHAGDTWRSGIGIVLQNSSDHARWRPGQLLAHVADFYRPYVDPWPVDELLEMVGLSGQTQQRIGTLSGGQRRRLDVALGIVGRPGVLFLDEPTTGFDPRARRDFHDLIHRLTDLEGTTILLTTHDLAEAEKLADRIVILADGRIVADGSPAQLTREFSGTAEVSWKQGGQHHVHATEDATAFLRQLLMHEELEGGDVTELKVQPATLEETYLSIVQQFEDGHAEGISELEGAAS